ncbi:hypothetical protein MHLP_04030 [Candidatus Mycoplasma haematolamae str. Purdue]|uniref:Uncharacterized protein n=1 Tax=Mycoplasma haematolamae (strain Purdue) TaxID=1212765 RepID=I7CGJ3_MYCHA|nr:hypothetical protein [Candidatus Mycoplasma haematolamae]AFO52386.1 hypothetical protein MHLP_04030 [Candidatus Mycoplasma haematolamae str. Purdue]
MVSISRIVGYLVATTIGSGVLGTGIYKAAAPTRKAVEEKAKIVQPKRPVGNQIHESWKRYSQVAAPLYTGVKKSDDHMCMINTDTKKEKCIHQRLYYMARNELKKTDRQAFHFDKW